MREPLDKQHGKSAQALLKYVPKHLYNIHWSLPSQLSWKASLLLACQIFGLLVNTLPGDKKNPLLKTDNLTIPIHMQLSQKHITCSQFFAAFLKSRRSFEQFEKKDVLITFATLKLGTLKM